VETFCAAKPQSRDLKTVQHMKCAMLERLVMHFLVALAYTDSINFSDSVSDKAIYDVLDLP